MYIKLNVMSMLQNEYKVIGKIIKILYKLIQLVGQMIYLI